MTTLGGTYTETFSGLRTSLLASEVANQDVYVPMIDGESRFFVLSVE